MSACWWSVGVCSKIQNTTFDWPGCVRWVNFKLMLHKTVSPRTISKVKVKFNRTENSLNHPMHQSTFQVNSRISCWALAEKIWQILHWHIPHNPLCFSAHQKKSTFCTTEASFKRETNRLYNGIRFITRKHCYFLHWKNSSLWQLHIGQVAREINV